MESRGFACVHHFLKVSAEHVCHFASLLINFFSHVLPLNDFFDCIFLGPPGGYQFYLKN